MLRLMDKGTHGLANVRFLRHCREFGLYPAWNLLYGLPGEEAADYEAMAEMLPALRFLTPPGGPRHHPAGALLPLLRGP